MLSFSKSTVFTMNYAHFFVKNMSCSKTTVFTMSYALFLKNHSFYNELYTVWLGAIFSSPASSSLEACPPGFPVVSSRRLVAPATPGSISQFLQ